MRHVSRVAVDDGAHTSYILLWILGIACTSLVSAHFAPDLDRELGKDVLRGDEPRTVEHESSMLSPESRPSPEAAIPIDADSRTGSAGDGREPDGSPTVRKGSASSAPRQSGAAAAGPASIPLPRPGEMIDTFRLDEAIGAGGMGAVFRARDTKLDRHVALKLLPPDQATDAEVVQRFYQEGRSAAQLDHENIARVFSIGQDGLFHYIAFEYIEGVTIRQRVESGGPLPIGEAVDVALHIANALVHASRRGVVHRDIKPSNIILTPQGRAKLVDMGLARRFERGGDHGLTQSGMTLGTFDYISPEQARDPRDVDVRSDLYSLGCTLFHMLTGRPPFPGGTVLQKLLQHQEEPPADVRSLNPGVPVELAAIIAKLMAKERERRYQGPEHLARDLLALAGSLGLERTPSELEHWIAQGHHAAWERHLVWLLPALGFIVVISGLAWWGREFSKPPPAANKPSLEAGSREPSDLNLAGSPVAPGRPAARAAAGPDGEAGASAFPRTIPVSSKEDLLATLVSAPRRSVVVLADDGPYRLGGRAWSSRSPALVADADLTIKAEAGVRPVLKLAGGAGVPDRGSPALLGFVGGHVVIEGVEFELDGATSSEPVSALHCENTELVLRGCSFRRRAVAPEDDRDFTAIRIRASRPRAGGAERPPALFADYCHFDGGQTAVRAEGPADVAMRDCTLGPAGPSFWFDQRRPELPIAAELRLIHTSILAGTGPTFRFEGNLVRVRVDDCVIAPAGHAPAKLVRVDDPRQLNWQGRSNLYGLISSFLSTAAGSGERTSIGDFAAWEQTPNELREVGSRVSTTTIWKASDPLQALAQERENPTGAFLLDPRLAAMADVGARQGPFGAILKDVRLAQRTTPARADSLSPPRGETVVRAEANAPKKAEPPSPPPHEGERAAGADGSSAPEDGSPAGSSQDPMNLPSMPPMATAGSVPAEIEPPPTGEATRAAGPETTKDDRSKAAGPAPPPRPAEPVASDEDVVRSAEQFLAMFRALGGKGGSLRIASGADLELPGLVVETTPANPVQVVAEPGNVRPRLRFRPAPMPGEFPTEWIGLFSLRSGSLRLQGLDLIVPEPEALPVDRLAAITVTPGAELVMTDCTITLSTRRPAASALAVNASQVVPDRERPAADAARAAVIELRNGFVRSAGDAVTVSGGCGLVLKLEDVMVATEGSLVHALGSVRPAAADAVPPPALSVRIDRIAARVKGGLVHLQTTPEQPVMPSVDIRAASAIVSTVTGDDPLFRLEGQDQLEELRDRIRWEGHNVAYHRIKTYRRDEIVQAGGLPRIYDRDDWTRAFSPTDDAPMLADLKFRHQADTSAPAWKVERDDLRLAAGSTETSLGPDAAKVPNPPSDEEL
jgi:serine/threonine-protein kinase